MIDDREWSDGELVVSIVSSSEYIGIFIPILRLLFLSVDRLKLGSLSSFSRKGVEIALGFLSAEGVYFSKALSTLAVTWQAVFLLRLLCQNFLRLDFLIGHQH